MRRRNPERFEAARKAVGARSFAVVEAVVLDGESTASYADRHDEWPYTSRWQLRTALDTLGEHLARSAKQEKAYATRPVPVRSIS